MLTRRKTENKAGAGLVLICLLVLAVGRHLYVTAASANAEPAHRSVRHPAALSDTPYSKPSVVAALQDRSVVESSGLVASRTTPGVFWTHNDSGDGPHLYCLREDASSCGRWTVEGVEAIDWEDISAGPGPVEGRPYLYIGDMGDNAGVRRSISIYVVPEPVIAPGDGMRNVGTIEAAQRLRLTYPDRPHDAETLLVHPITGDIYIVTKDGTSVSTVFKVAPPFARHMRLTRVASFGILDNFSERTGGDISPDGKRVVFSTYLKAYEKRIGDGDFDSIWRQPAIAIDLGRVAQREGIAYGLDGRLFATSEGPDAALVVVSPST